MDHHPDQRIEYRRTLHAHAVEAKEAGCSADEWETWARGRAEAMIEAIGEREFDSIVRVVWMFK